MAYAVRCESCENYFTKFSNRDANTRCEDCKPRKGNRHRQRANVVEEFSTRLANLEGWQERMDLEMQLWQDALKAELIANLGDIVEEMLPTAMGPQLTMIEEKFMGKLATVNTRLLAINPESTLIEQMREIEMSIDMKLGALQNLSKQIEVAQEKVGATQEFPKSYRRSLRQISDCMRETLCDEAIEYMFSMRDKQQWFRRGELLDGVWNIITPVVATAFMREMLRTNQLVRKGARTHSVGLHPDLLVRMESYEKYELFK